MAKNRADGLEAVDYPVVACPGCNTTDTAVVPGGGTGSTRAAFRIRKCRNCGMRFKEPVPEPAKK